MIVEENLSEFELREELDLPEKFVTKAFDAYHEIQSALNGSFGHSPDTAPSFNTYNLEYHSLTQCLEIRSLGSIHSDYVIVHVHNGCDIRGGYTAPRVFKTSYAPFPPTELQYDCRRLDWYEAESCLFRSDKLLYVRDIDNVENAVRKRCESEGIDIDSIETHPAVEQAYQYNEEGYMNGAVFVFPENENDFGIVTFG